MYFRYYFVPARLFYGIVFLVFFLVLYLLLLVGGMSDVSHTLLLCWGLGGRKKEEGSIGWFNKIQWIRIRMRSCVRFFLIVGELVLRLAHEFA